MSIHVHQGHYRVKGDEYNANHLSSALIWGFSGAIAGELVGLFAKQLNQGIERKLSRKQRRASQAQNYAGRLKDWEKTFLPGLEKQKSVLDRYRRALSNFNKTFKDAAEFAKKYPRGRYQGSLRGGKRLYYEARAILENKARLHAQLLKGEGTYVKMNRPVPPRYPSSTETFWRTTIFMAATTLTDVEGWSAALPIEPFSEPPVLFDFGDSLESHSPLDSSRSQVFADVGGFETY